MIRKVAGLRRLISAFPDECIPTHFLGDVGDIGHLRAIAAAEWYLRQGRLMGHEYGARSHVFGSLEEMIEHLQSNPGDLRQKIAHPLSVDFWNLSHVGAVCYWEYPVETIEIAFQGTSGSILNRLRSATYSPRELNAQSIFTYEYLVKKPRVMGRPDPAVAQVYLPRLFPIGEWMATLDQGELVCRFLLHALHGIVLTDLRSPSAL